MDESKRITRGFKYGDPKKNGRAAGSKNWVVGWELGPPNFDVPSFQITIAAAAAARHAGFVTAKMDHFVLFKRFFGSRSNPHFPAHPVLCRIVHGIL
jgi:hypothetical protein